MAIFAVQYPIFQRAMRVIGSISNSYPAVITTTFAHQYKTGLIVRLNIPTGYGMTAINQKYTPIIVTSPTTFTMDLDTTELDPFVAPTAYPYSSQYAQVTPIGEVNEILTNATQNVLPYNAI